MNEEMKALLQAVVDGKQMQQMGDNHWKDCTPNCAIYRISQGMKTRIKPEPKPDFVYHTRIIRLGIDCIEFQSVERELPANLKLTFDGDTRALKSAEVVL